MTNKLLLRFYHKEEKKMYWDMQERESKHRIIGVFGPYLLCTSNGVHRVFHITEGVVMHAILAHRMKKATSKTYQSKKERRSRL